MFEAIGIGLTTFLLGIVYASFAEWVIHKYMMHRPIFGYSHFYVAHAQVHHAKYQANAAYWLGDRPAVDLTFAPWAMPFPALFHAPYLIAIGIWISIPAAIGPFVAFIVYQATYEYFHFCMHVPKGRWFEQNRIFKFMNEHHYQHHQKANTNLNVVLPLADWILGTRRKLVEPMAAKTLTLAKGA
jgi:hypothetical protein